MIASITMSAVTQRGHWTRTPECLLGAKIAERHVRCSGGLRASSTFSSSTIRAGKGRA